MAANRLDGLSGTDNGAENKRTIKVGVFPVREFQTRPRLFGALQRAFPVSFEARALGDWDGLDAAIVIGASCGDAGRSSAIPCFFAAPNGTRNTRTAASAEIRFSSVSELDPRIRGLTLHEESMSHDPRLVAGSDTVTLASVDGIPIWQLLEGPPRREVTALAPGELGEGESLRDLLGGRRFIALLPWIHFLRGISGYDSWTRPPLRAAFVFDDANLHRPTYGRIRFAEMAAHAKTHGYHAVMAMIPLDTWFTHQTAARIFREHPSEISLTAHGNDHLYGELEPEIGAAAGPAIFGQAIRRIERFEASANIAVSRVVVPPHGRCSFELLESMAAAGFEAFCNSGSWWDRWPVGHRSLAGWHPATMTPNGLPVMSRYRLDDVCARDELAICAFLDQPMILGGHHYDLAEGYDCLADLAEWTRTLGDVHWEPMSKLAQSNVMTRVDSNGCLRVRSFSLRFGVHVPVGVDAMVLDIPGHDSNTVLLDDSQAHAMESGQNGWNTVRVPVVAGRFVDVRVVREVRDRSRADAFRMRPHAYARRAVGESRDRLQPLISRAGLGSFLRRGELAFHNRMHRASRRAG